MYVYLKKTNYNLLNLIMYEIIFVIQIFYKVILQYFKQNVLYIKLYKIIKFALWESNIVG